MDRSVITYVLKCDKCMSLLEHHGTTLQEKLQLKATVKEEKQERAVDAPYRKDKVKM